MTYLLMEMLFFLAVAAALGILVGWLFTMRRWQQRLEQLEEGWAAKQQLVEHQTERLNAQFAKASRERDQASSAYHDMAKELADLRLELTRAQRDLAGFESRSESLSGELQERRNQENELQRALDDASREKERQQSEAQRLTGLVEEQEQQLQDRQVLEERLDLYQRQLGELDELREKLQSLTEAKREQEARAQSDIAQNEQRLSALRDELEELGRQNAAQRDALETSARSEQELRVELSRLTKEISTLRTSRAAAGAQGSQPEAQPVAAAADSEHDDLKRIKGIGPGLEKLLNQHGVSRFSDIAGWQAKDIAWFSSRLNFKGRIERDDWVGQARLLMAQGD
jgi:predicted flap endonuclease-1-like 5' DNA nuclease